MEAQYTRPKVIAGLRLLPWVSWQRRKNADERPHDNYGKRYLDCTTCTEMTEREQRRAMGCGWEPEGERLGVITLPAGFPECDECPGRLVQLPEVYEAARALSWKQDGLLDEYFDGDQLTPLARDCIDIFATECREVEAHALRVAKEGSRGPH